MTKIIAVLLPGTTATVLKLPLDPVPVWPDAVALAAFIKLDRFALDLLDDTNLEPAQPLNWNTDTGYGNFVQFFATKYGFVPHVVNSAHDVQQLPLSEDRHLLGFGYDWRQDNTKTGGVLQGVLEAIDAKLGAGSYETWLIAHSMGGLVARALLEPNVAANAQTSWFKAIQGLITLGTPHLGAPLALQAIAGDLPQTGHLALIATIVPQFINGSSTNAVYDSTYELLPPPDQLFVNADGTATDLFDLPADAQQALTQAGESATYLADAKTFFGTLRYDGDPALPPYYCVYGVSPTTATVTGAAYSSGAGWTFSGATGAGDTVVPEDSAMFKNRAIPPAATYQPPGDVNHFELPGNADVQQFIASVMKLAP